MRPPGDRALEFASRWLDPATVHRTFEPLVADWQREWMDALPSKRWVVQIKGLAAFCAAAIVSMPVIVRSRAPKTLTDQIARRVTIGAAIGTALLMLPFTTGFGPLWHRGLMAVVVIPQGLTLAFPFALLAGVDSIRRFNGVSVHAARATVAKLAVFGMAFVFFCHGWVTPAANQVYREAMYEASIKAQSNADTVRRIARARRLPVPGVREMSNVELLTTIAGREDADAGTHRSAMATAAQEELNKRGAIAFLPALLVWRRWRALDLPHGRWLSPRHVTVAAVAMAVAFSGLLAYGQHVERAWHMFAGAGPWLTLLLLGSIGMLRVWVVERSAARA
jgi:hypothetical protein